MCYLVLSHTLRCDVRPRISDGVNTLIDPYSAPSCCECSRFGATRKINQCELHGCCSMTCRFLLCRSSKVCEPLLTAHLYTQQKQITHNKPMWPDSPRFTLMHTDGCWEVIDTLDQEQLSTPCVNLLSTIDQKHNDP